MRKHLLLLLLGSLMLGQCLTSKAISFTITTTGGNWVTTGITSDHGKYNNTLVPFVSGVGATSALSYGLTLTSENNGRPSSDTFTSPAVSFEFDVMENTSSITHHYVVDGTFVGISGSAVAKMTVDANGFGESKAAFRAKSVTVDGSVVFSSVVPSPLLIQSIKTTMLFGGLSVDVYVDHLDQLTAPGDFSTALSVGGFIQARAVPEPGSVGLLLGCGVSGSLLLLRRRRR